MNNMFKHIGNFLTKHGPKILVGVGLLSAGATVVLAVSETPRAIDSLSEAEEEKGEELTLKEKITVTWKCYIPAAITGTISVATIIFATQEEEKRNAALTTLCCSAEAALIEYKNAAIETLGKKKARDVEETVMKNDILNDLPIEENITYTTNGKTLCKDYMSGRYFRSDIDAIKRAVNTLNARLKDEIYISLNEFYSEIGLERTGLGELTGFNLDVGYIEIDVYPIMALIGGVEEPCAMISFIVGPRTDYMNLH